MKKALVIEDHPDMMDILTWNMEMMGFSVIAANNGTDGVVKAFEEKPQVILMDIMMPGIDGRDAVRQIRSNPETKDIPILASTVLFRESDLKSCIEAGCNDVIQKPFNYKQLQGKLRGIA